MSSLTISAASILALSAGAALGRGKRSLALSGIAVTVLAALLILATLWFEFGNHNFLRTVASVGTLAVALSHSSLLALARLARRYEWIRFAAYGAVAALTAVLIVLYWTEFNEQWFFRLMGILSICVTVLTVLVPIFHRLSIGELRATGARPEKVNFARVFAGITDTWNPEVVASLNDSHVIRASRLLGTYVRHKHTREDEFFLVVRGSLLIRFDDATVKLDEGEGLLVPAGVYHEPEATEEAHVLLFEPASTVKTGS
jgi:mannose-6-phosphate isomerase-like protein (cupin superfamily)